MSNLDKYSLTQNFQFASSKISGPIARTTSNPEVKREEQKEKEQKNQKKGKKKRTKKEEENEGVRIAKQKKIEYLFRNICDPDGKITFESLGKSLVKHKIEFKVRQLKDMLSLCLNDEVALEEQEINQDSNAIDEETQNIQIDFEDFKKLYERLY